LNQDVFAQPGSLGENNRAGKFTREIKAETKKILKSIQQVIIKEESFLYAYIYE